MKFLNFLTSIGISHSSSNTVLLVMICLHLSFVLCLVHLAGQIVCYEYQHSLPDSVLTIS